MGNKTDIIFVESPFSIPINRSWTAGYISDRKVLYRVDVKNMSDGFTVLKTVYFGQETGAIKFKKRFSCEDCAKAFALNLVNQSNNVTYDCKGHTKI